MFWGGWRVPQTWISLRIFFLKLNLCLSFVFALWIYLLLSSLFILFFYINFLIHRPSFFHLPEKNTKEIIIIKNNPTIILVFFLWFHTKNIEIYFKDLGGKYIFNNKMAQLTLVFVVNTPLLHIFSKLLLLN